MVDEPYIKLEDWAGEIETPVKRLLYEIKEGRLVAEYYTTPDSGAMNALSPSEAGDFLRNPDAAIECGGRVSYPVIVGVSMSVECEEPRASAANSRTPSTRREGGVCIRCGDLWVSLDERRRFEAEHCRGADGPPNQEVEIKNLRFAVAGLVWLLVQRCPAFYREEKPSNRSLSADIATTLRARQYGSQPSDETIRKVLGRVFKEMPNPDGEDE